MDNKPDYITLTTSNGGWRGVRVNIKIDKILYIERGEKRKEGTAELIEAGAIIYLPGKELPVLETATEILKLLNATIVGTTN